MRERRFVRSDAVTYAACEAAEAAGCGARAAAKRVVDEWGDHCPRIYCRCVITALLTSRLVSEAGGGVEAALPWLAALLLTEHLLVRLYT